MAATAGKVSQIIGPVVDVTFSGTGTKLPKIYDSLEITTKSGDLLILEVQSHVGEDTGSVGTEPSPVTEPQLEKTIALAVSL